MRAPLPKNYNEFGLKSFRRRLCPKLFLKYYSKCPKNLSWEVCIRKLDILRLKFSLIFYSYESTFFRTLNMLWSKTLVSSTPMCGRKSSVLIGSRSCTTYVCCTAVCCSGGKWCVMEYERHTNSILI